MSLDISSILKDWPYHPGRVSARRICGDDGCDRIQLRLDMGLLQMEASGRPDGTRPHGQESLLAYYEQQLRHYTEEHDGEEGFELDEGACELLRAEGVMYYHRYLAEFVLEDYDAVERDTVRNLRLMDFCSSYAEGDSDRYVLEQYRPYVLMMRTRALAQKALSDSRPKAALAAVNEGTEAIEAFYSRFGQDELASGSGEVAILRAMAKEIESRIPADPRLKLREALEKALEEERYEEAASLRDRLRHTASSKGKGGREH